MSQASSFTFGSYSIDTARSVISFTYRVEFQSGRVRTYTDRLMFPDVSPEMWSTVPPEILEPTLQSLLLMLGINYWSVYPTPNMHIDGFALTREQAEFWDSLYLNGLAEFFYDMKMDFRGLISFPFDESRVAPAPAHCGVPSRALLLNGAGKDSILSAEMLRAQNVPFDFFAFAPTPAHTRIGRLVGAKTITVTRRRDARINAVNHFRASSAYPSVSTFTFIATLLAEVLGYSDIIFSNERSADFGNLTYLGLEVNHQWCKSSAAEKMINDYIHRYITPDIATSSLLRKYSELEIVRQFVQYPQYLRYFTSCNTYFWLPRIQQKLMWKSYWCKQCPKCMFLFASFSAFLPKSEMIKIFGADLYADKRLVSYVTRTLGIEGYKPLDCVGEPEEMILAMHYASLGKEYAGDISMTIFEQHFPPTYDFASIERTVLSKNNDRFLSKIRSGH